MKKKLKITIVDIIVLCIFVIFLITFVFFIVMQNENGTRKLLIEADNSSYYYNLDEDRILRIKGSIGITEIEIHNGRFRFVSSQCVNHDCINMGWVHISGYPVICLPNKVSAYITGENIEYDGISR